MRLLRVKVSFVVHASKEFLGRIQRVDCKTFRVVIEPALKLRIDKVLRIDFSVLNEPTFSCNIFQFQGEIRVKRHEVHIGSSVDFRNSRIRQLIASEWIHHKDRAIRLEGERTVCGRSKYRSICSTAHQQRTASPKHDTSFPCSCSCIAKTNNVSITQNLGFIYDQNSL